MNDPHKATPPLQLTDQERVELVARVIRQLLHEHELAGLFMVCAPTHCAHGLMLETAPWLRMQTVEDSQGATVGLRVRAKLDEYLARGLSEPEAKARQQREIEYTVSALDFLYQQGRPVVELSKQALAMMRERFGSVTTNVRVGDAWGKPQ